MNFLRTTIARTMIFCHKMDKTKHKLKVRDQLTSKYISPLIDSFMSDTLDAHVFDFFQLKDWDSHQNRYHGQLVQRFRERSVIASMGPEDGN